MKKIISVVSLLLALVVVSVSTAAPLKFTLVSKSSKFVRASQVGQTLVFKSVKLIPKTAYHYQCTYLNGSVGTGLAGYSTSNTFGGLTLRFTFAQLIGPSTPGGDVACYLAKQTSQTVPLANYQFAGTLS